MKLLVMSLVIAPSLIFGCSPADGNEKSVHSSDRVTNQRQLTSVETPIPIGSATDGVVTLPRDFYHDNDCEQTLFVMPRKDDLEGPVSMRITCLMDISASQPSPEMIREMLRDSPGGDNIKEENDRFTITSEEDFTDESQVAWHLRHCSVVADDLLFTITIGTVKGRENEPQCKELSEALPKIIASLARKEQQGLVPTPDPPLVPVSSTSVNVGRVWRQPARLIWRR